MTRQFSLGDIVEWLLEKGVSPSDLCLGMRRYYANKALADEKHGPRWEEIANACQAAAEVFRKINI